ncbi:tRNA(Ile)-lysidine synthase [bacterium HR20]|nr:tRNA(Ile)-lysidine synthase [bacterium HR20]
MPSSRSKNKQPQPSAPEPQHPQRKRRVRNTATASDVEPPATTVTEPSAERLSSPLQPSDEELSAFITQLKQSQRSTGAPTMQPPDETNGQPPQHAGAAASNQPIPVPQQTKPAARQAQKSKARTSPPEHPPTPPAPPEAEQSPSQQPTPPNSVAHQQQHHAHSQSESGNSSKRRRKHRRKKSAPTPAATPAGQENKPQTTDQPHAEGNRVPEPAAAPTEPQKSTQQKSKRPHRTFVVRDLVAMPEIPDECIPTIEHVEHMLTSELDVEPGASILIAISGGVDSVVLLDMLFILSFEHGYRLHLAHVNHKLRAEESDRDEAFVRALAKRYDLPCHVTHVETAAFARKHRLSIEEAARELRYRFLRQMCGTTHAQYCAVAHTADDTAETLLLNLVRGSGLTGLAAIPPRRPLTKKAALIRPLIGITRQQILQYATARSLEWIEDSTNADRSFLRNRIRHDVLPTLREQFNPRIIETLARTAELLRQADGFIESFIESTFLQIATIYDGRVELNKNALGQMHPFLQGELIERALGELTDHRTVPHAAVERVRSLLAAETGTRQSVTGSIVAVADREHLVLSDESTLQAIYLPIFKLGTYHIGRFTITLEEVERNDVRLGADPNVEYFDYDKLPYRLFLRTWQAGDRFAPIGMGNRDVLVADYLTNAKTSDYDRRTAVVLATASDIVWLCGYRMSEHFKLTNETRRIIRATFQRT